MKVAFDGRVLADHYPGHWMTCGASGVVGYGLGGAMAARLTYPSHPVILLTGDGSMGFNLADLESAVRHRLPFVVLVADDQEVNRDVLCRRLEREGHQVVTVVSAMGHTTDLLVDLAKEITDEPAAREMDMLLSTG